jgi:hypothetical protein
LGADHAHMICARLIESDPLVQVQLDRYWCFREGRRSKWNLPPLTRTKCSYGVRGSLLPSCGVMMKLLTRHVPIV